MTNPVRVSFLILLILSGVITVAGADTLYLKNGRSMEGIIKSEDQDNIDLEVFGGMVRLKKTEIDRVERSNQEDTNAILKKWEIKRLQTVKQAREGEIRKEFEPKQVEFAQQSGQIIVGALINKKVNVSLVLDTGASYVVLSGNVAKKLGLNPADPKLEPVEMILADGRKVIAKRLILESLSSQGVEAKNVAATILPVGSDNSNIKDGLLGMSFLKNFNFKVDQKNNKLILEKLGE